MREEDLLFSSLFGHFLGTRLSSHLSFSSGKKSPFQRSRLFSFKGAGFIPRVKLGKPEKLGGLHSPITPIVLVNLLCTILGGSPLIPKPKLSSKVWISS